MAWGSSRELSTSLEAGIGPREEEPFVTNPLTANSKTPLLSLVADCGGLRLN